MAHRKLVDTVREEIARNYETKGWSQKYLAQTYGVSTRTIQRILKEYGVLPQRIAWTADQEKIVRIVKRYDLTAEQLTEKLREVFTLVPPPGSKPSYSELVDHLSAQDPKMISSLFYDVAMKRIGKALIEETKKEAISA